MSKQNQNSPFDGICPKGYNYNCKSSCLSSRNQLVFHIKNKEIKKIQILFLGGFNKDFTKLLHVWMIPISAAYRNVKGKLCLRSAINISISKRGLRKWKQYEITDKCLDKLLTKQINIKTIQKK